jgi:hypothetical protein
MFAASTTSGVTMVFPDVCKTPAAGLSVPIPTPYPNFAKSAVASQRTKIGGVRTITVGGTVHSSVQGDEAGTLKGVTGFKPPTGAKATEIQQIKMAMNGINAKLQSMATMDPNEWQTQIFEYMVLTSALYVTLKSG